MYVTAMTQRLAKFNLNATERTRVETDIPASVGVTLIYRQSPKECLSQRYQMPDLILSEPREIRVKTTLPTFTQLYRFPPFPIPHQERNPFVL